MSNMNGQDTAAAPLDPDAQAVVTCLEQLLAEAKRGGIVCIGVALVKGDKHFTTTGTLVPRYLMELAECAEDLHDMAKEAMRKLAQQQAAAQQQRSGILRPGPGFDPRRMG